MKNHEAEAQEERDKHPWWKDAERIVSNGECAAQLDVPDTLLRASLIRNVAVALLAAETETRERVETETAREAAKAVCDWCRNGERVDFGFGPLCMPVHMDVDGEPRTCHAALLLKRFPSAAIRNLPPSSTPTTNTEAQ